MEFTGGYFAFSAAVQDFISASNSEDGKAVGYCAAGVIEAFLGFASMFSAANNANSSISMRKPPIAQDYYSPLDPSEIANKIHNAERTGSGLNNGHDHRAACYLTEEMLSKGKTNYFTGNDGVRRILLQVKGQLDGEDGVFEYILEPDGTVSHERFIRGGRYTGTPNQKKSS